MIHIQNRGWTGKRNKSTEMQQERKLNLLNSQLMNFYDGFSVCFNSSTYLKFFKTKMMGMIFNYLFYFIIN